MLVKTETTAPVYGWAYVWPTDADLAQEPDFERALEILRRDVDFYWKKKLGALEKEACEIEDYLNYLIEHECRYEDLLPKQRNLLQHARRLHYTFWRKVNEVVELL